MPRTNKPTSEDESSSGEADSGKKRKSRLIKSLETCSRKRKKSHPVDPYRRYAAWYSRSEDPLVNYNLVLETLLAWDTWEFGGLSEEKFRDENWEDIQAFRGLITAHPTFIDDFRGLMTEPEEIEHLAKVLNDAVTAARGADISSIRETGLGYVALEQAGDALVPRIHQGAKKETTRGFNHPMLGRLLCPVKYLKEYDDAPEEFRKKLLRNEVKVFAGDYPTLLYADDEIDPDDPESGLFKSKTLLRIFKHIFTGPTSAKADISATVTKGKTKKPQAVNHDMRAVTPGSIAYAALMYRHCLSALDDWRTEDDLFDRQRFIKSIRTALSDDEDTWVQDTLAWWNAHVFGTPPEPEEVENREPSTVDLLEQKREARKATRAAANARNNHNGRQQASGMGGQQPLQRSESPYSNLVDDQRPNTTPNSPYHAGGDKHDYHSRPPTSAHAQAEAGPSNYRHTAAPSSPLVSCQNVPPRHQRLHQSDSMRHHSHSPISRSRSPEYRQRPQSSPVRPSNRDDVRASSSGYRPVTSSRDHQSSARNGQSSVRERNSGSHHGNSSSYHDQHSSRRSPISADRHSQHAHNVSPKSRDRENERSDTINSPPIRDLGRRNYGP